MDVEFPKVRLDLFVIYTKSLYIYDPQTFLNLISLYQLNMIRTSCEAIRRPGGSLNSARIFTFVLKDTYFLRLNNQSFLAYNNNNNNNNLFAFHLHRWYCILSKHREKR